MHCRNYTGTISCVLCREVYYTVPLFGRAHHRRFTVTKQVAQCIVNVVHLMVSL